MYNEPSRQELAQMALSLKRQDLVDAAMWMGIYRKHLNKSDNLRNGAFYAHMIEKYCKIWLRLIRGIVEIEEKLNDSF